MSLIDPMIALQVSMLVLSFASIVTVTISLLKVCRLAERTLSDIRALREELLRQGREMSDLLGETNKSA